ncbi:hypothetical protein AAVH_05841 [Aphelenchoides avenae]|nr:hypothetical protein AAVH_05841 [Aphelenchus avenae]
MEKCVIHIKTFFESAFIQARKSIALTPCIDRRLLLFRFPPIPKRTFAAFCGLALLVPSFGQYQYGTQYGTGYGYGTGYNTGLGGYNQQYQPYGNTGYGTGYGTQYSQPSYGGYSGYQNTYGNSYYPSSSSYGGTGYQYSQPSYGGYSGYGGYGSSYANGCTYGKREAGFAPNAHNRLRRCA